MISAAAMDRKCQAAFQLIRKLENRLKDNKVAFFLLLTAASKEHKLVIRILGEKFTEEFKQNNAMVEKNTTKMFIRSTQGNDCFPLTHSLPSCLPHFT